MKKNSLHHKQLVHKVTTAKSFVKAGTPLPAESALRYHSFQTYFLKTQQEGSNLHAIELRWKVKLNKFIPVLTDLEAATQLYSQNN